MKNHFATYFSTRSFCLSLTITLTLFLTGFQTLKSQTVYTSINGGPWSNTVDVWSTDGVNPCGCAPGQLIVGFNVVVNHNITASGIIRTQAGDSLIINGTGSLGSNFWLIATGHVENLGNLRVDSARITAAPGRIANYGSFTTNGNLRMTFGDFDNYGQSTIGGDLINTSGNIWVYPGGFLGVFGNLSLYSAGSMRNITTAACVQVTGNVYSDSTSIVAGLGSIAVINNIVNDTSVVLGNFWDPQISWCAGGTATNMPSPPNCDGPCMAILPVELADFSAQLTSDATVKLDWITVKEVNNDYFTLERSQDGENFSFVATLNSHSGTTNRSDNYSFTDLDPLQGHSIYRLSQTDIDGKSSQLGTVNIFNDASINSSYTLFPNPFTDELRLVFQSEETGDLSLNVTDLSGREVHREVISRQPGFNEYSMELGHLRPGAYLVTLNSGLSVIRHFKVLHN